MGLTTELLQAPSDRPLLAALRELMLKSGDLIEAENAGAERSLFLVPGKSSVWTAVYDTSFGTGRQLACDFSRAIAAPVASILVNDSDQMEMHLCREGRVAASLASEVGRGKVKGKPELWAGLLTGGAGATELREALESAEVFVENRLGRAVALFGMDPETCMYTTQDFAEETGVTALHFRSKQARRAVEGPPVLAVSHGSRPVEVMAGGLIGPLSAIAANRGGASRGLRIEIGGSAIAQKLIEIVDCTLVQFPEGDASPDGPVRTPVGMVDDVAELPDAALYAKVDALDLITRYGAAKGTRLVARSNFYVNVNARAVSPGVGELSIKLTPQANSAGAAVTTIPVRILGEMWKPLRAVAGFEQSALALHDPKTLCAQPAMTFAMPPCESRSSDGRSSAVDCTRGSAGI